MFGMELEKNYHIDPFDDNRLAEKKKLQIPQLFRLQSCPPWLQFNKFVLDGYRLHLTTRQCLESLFYIHNESFNIYSHGKFLKIWSIQAQLWLISLIKARENKINVGF